MRSFKVAFAMSLVTAMFVAGSADARTLFAGNQTPATISAFAFSSSGQLTAVTGSPFASATQEPRNLIVSADGRELYLGHRTVNKISQKSIAADGSISSLAPDVNFPNGINAQAISPDGRSLYSSSGSFNTALQRYTIAADGTLTAAEATPIASNGGGVAVTPDGRFLYVCSSIQGLYAFSLNADGVPSAIPGFPIMSQSCAGTAITPDGKFLLTVSFSTGLRVYAIAADGSFAQVGSSITTGPSPNYIAVAPDSRSAYVMNLGSAGAGANIAAFSLATDGAPSHVGTDVTITPANTFANGLAIAPDGRHLVASANTATSNVFVFATSLDGSLTPVSGSPFSSGSSMVGGSASQELAFQPNQGPTLASVTVAGTNRERSFTASGASDSDGSVTGYQWDFGDGTTATTDGPTTKHVYAQSGNYTARASAVDNEGCGPRDLYDGRQYLCDAATGASVAVDAAAPALSKLRLSKKKIKRGGSTKLSYKLSEAGTVKLQFQLKKGKKYKTRGTLSFTSKAGSLKRTVKAKIKRKKLAAGKYRVLVTATDTAKNSSSAKRLTLTIR